MMFSAVSWLKCRTTSACRSGLSSKLLAACPAGTATPTGIPGGANSCKGHSDCKTANSSCKGLNACKGQGFVALTKEQCDAKGGTFEG